MQTLTFTPQNYLRAHAQLAERLDWSAFQAGVDLVARKFAEGRRVITCGNGGSASTASHYITDWAKMGNLATGGSTAASPCATTSGSSPPTATTCRTTRSSWAS